jgi:hypothetical protein
VGAIRSREQHHPRRVSWTRTFGEQRATQGYTAGSVRVPTRGVELEDDVLA